MKRFKSIVLTLITVFIFAASAVVPISSVVADSTTGSSSLSIAPEKSYVIDSGGTTEDTIIVRNMDSTNDLILNLSVIDFTYKDDSGSPSLMLDTTAEPTTWSLRSYLTVPEEVTIEPNGSASIPIEITIPEEVGAGSYYSAIMYSTGASSGGNVGLSASGVTLVFVNVPGQVEENLTLKNFGVYNKTNKSYTGVITQIEPGVIGYTLENTGNVVEAPVGTIKLKDMWGHTYTIDDINPINNLALIGQTRTFQSCVKLSEDQDSESSTTDASTCVSPGMWPGFYTASIDVYYGQNGNTTKEVTDSTFFFYLPLWFIVVVIIVILIIAFLIWRLVVAIKKKTRTPRGHRSSKMMRR